MKYSNNRSHSIGVKYTLGKTSTKYIDKTDEAIESMPKNVDGYQVKRANNKVLKMKLKTKFDLYRFILAKVVCLEISGLDLVQNTLLILLHFFFFFFFFLHNVEIKYMYIYFIFFLT